MRTTANALQDRPRLALVGPMLSRNEGWVATQGEILGDLLSREGYDVRLTSGYVARSRRLADTLASLVAWRNQVDLVIHMVFSGPAFHVTDAASALCRTLGWPQIFVLHGGSLPEFAADNQQRVGRVLGRAAAVVSPSGFLSSIFSAEFGQPVTVIPNILEIDDYPFRLRTSAAPRLLWMRTFHEIYQPQLAIETLVELRRTHPQATLTMAGQDKGLLPTLQAMVADLNLTDAVRFAGFLDKAGKDSEFANHDIYLNTNRVDNMPVSVLEAAAYGVPVVATAVGGIPFLLRDGETGLLVPDGDAPAMAAGVERLLTVPALTQRLSDNGRRLAEASAWPVVRAQWEALFQSVLAPTIPTREAPYA